MLIPYYYDDMLKMHSNSISNSIRTNILPVGFNEDIQFHFVLLSELEWTGDIAADITVFQGKINT